MTKYCITLLVVGVTYIYALGNSPDSINVFSNGFTMSVKIIPEKYHDKKNNTFAVREYYEYSNPSLPGSFKNPSINLLVAIPAESKPNVRCLVVDSTKYWNVIPEINPELKYLDDSTVVEKIPSSTNYELDTHFFKVVGFQWVGDFYCMNIRINKNLINLNKQTITEIKKILLSIDFDKETILSSSAPIIPRTQFESEMINIIENKSIAEQFRFKLLPKVAKIAEPREWIKGYSEYIKISVIQDELLRITKNDLIKTGINIDQINPETFQLFESGKEVPIIVEGESDKNFGINDYIEFFGQKNYSKISSRVINKNNEPYNEFMNRYTDTTYYFLVWNVKNGLRVQKNFNINNVSPVDTVNYYDSFTHYEDNPLDALYYTFHESIIQSQFPFWDTNKGWYWKWLASWSSKISQPITTKNLVLSKTAKIFAKVSSYGSNQSIKPHLLELLVNSQKVDSLALDRYGRTLLKGEMKKYLKEGNNNTEITYKENNGSTSGACVLDWIEVEYPKKIEIVNGKLNFDYLDMLEIKPRIVSLENAKSNNYSIWRIKPNLKKIEKYTISNSRLTFYDTLGTGYTYSLSATDLIPSPVTLKLKHFSDINNDKNSTDYIAVTSEKFSKSVQEYVNTIKSINKLNANIYFVEDIFDQYGFGYPDPKALKEFVKFKYDQNPEHRPSYLTIIGDANYDYKGLRYIQAKVRVGENYVPAYGFPVSDSWYAIFDSVNTVLPQMFVGRIPVNNSDELNFYKNKIQKFYERKSSLTDKTIMLFTGGTVSETEQLKTVHEEVIRDYLKPQPLAGNVVHFYKTKNSDLGPYDKSFISNTLAEGASFISYLGHSGTATWDNSINSVVQLKNVNNYSPVISDYGCSTNKFAEPDIICFGERFILDADGQALAYIGNSALGFNSIAQIAPKLLFESLVKDSIRVIGKLHFSTKKKMFQRYGNSDVSKVFTYTNTLLGDPSLEVLTPQKVNLHISDQNLELIHEQLNDQDDSTSIKIFIENWGLSMNKEYNFKLLHFYEGKKVVEKITRLRVPDRVDSLRINIDTKLKPGKHVLTINVDSENEINELDESDNTLSKTIQVFSSIARDIQKYQFENAVTNSIIVLSPTTKQQNQSNLILQTSNIIDFSKSSISQIKLDSSYKRIQLVNSRPSTRIWWRYGSVLTDTVWSGTKSAFYMPEMKFIISDKYSFDNQITQGLQFVSGIKLKIDTTVIGVLSAGAFAGNTAAITINGINILPNNYFTGVCAAVFDPVTLHLDTVVVYDLWNNSANHAAFSNFCNKISNGKLMALAISGDAVNNNSAQFRNSLKSIGSLKSDSIVFKSSWAFIGYKGGDPKLNQEVYKSPYSGIITLGRSFTSTVPQGKLLTTEIGPASNWKSISIVSDKLSTSSKIKLIGIQNSGAVDTLLNPINLNGKTDISSLNSVRYKTIKLQSEIKSNQGETPTINSIMVNYLGVPELGTNYQVVSLSKDSLDQGETANLNFSVYNVGESTASNFKVRVNLVKKDNSKERLFEQVVDSIQTEKKKDFSFTYTTDKLTGSNQFQITIDPDNSVTELYKDNNFYSVPFYVKPNNKPASLKLTIDGNDIVNGDFISSKPNFKIELSDESLIPITDTTKILLYLNNKRLYFASNNNIINYNYSSSNPKMVVNYTPTLADGNYTFKVVGKNATDQIIDSTGIVRKFTVKNEMQLLNAYNYPNPFKDDTYFTFKLTQIPDELKIIIYTIAGRKIKEIKLSAAELKFDFNRIFWDGRDQDGDLAANGVYLYKIISQKGSEKTELTQKLSVLR